jgi:hypothetical protein
MQQHKMLFLLTTLLLITSTSVFAQWEPDQRLTNTASNSFLANNNAWNIAASGDSIHVIYIEYESGNSQIHYTCSYDAGLNWNTPVTLSQGPCDILAYTLAVSGSTVHAVWINNMDNRLIYRRSTNAGITWEQEDTIVYPGTQNVGDPCLAASGNNVYLVYTHNPASGYNVDLFFISSTNGGVSWSAAQRLTYDTNNIMDGAPSIAVSGNILHLIWGRVSNPSNWHRRVLYLRSTNNGAAWEPERYITSDTISQSQPTIAAAGNFVYAIWMDQRTDSIQLYYRSSPDNGVNWQTEKCLTNNIISADYQTIAAIGRNVHVAWRDYRYYNQWHIGYRRSTDNGQTWQPDTFFYDAFHQESPSIAVAGTKVHLIWIDNRAGNWEIYYKRNPTGSGIEEENQQPLLPDRFLLEIYPNPAKTYFTIRLPQIVDPTQIKIFDVSGKMVKEVRCKTQESRITLDGIKSGIYFISLQSQLNTIIQRIVVVK